MKISNYFLLSLLALFLGGMFMIASYANSITEVSDNLNQQYFFTGERLSKFSVIVAEEGAIFDLNFVGNELSNRISYPTTQASSYKASPYYTVRNDTLFVNNKNYSKPYSLYENLEINCNGIKSFIGKAGSSVKVTAQIPGGLQTYTLDHAELVFYGGRLNKINLISITNAQFKIAAKHSKIKFNSFGYLIDLHLDLNSSYFLVDNSGGGGRNIFDKITGTLKNDSRADFLYNNVIRKIDLKGDNTSSFYRKSNR